jgi:hypothetical protein
MPDPSAGCSPGPIYLRVRHIIIVTIIIIIVIIVNISPAGELTFVGRLEIVSNLPTTVMMCIYVPQNQTFEMPARASKTTRRSSNARQHLHRLYSYNASVLPSLLCHPSSRNQGHLHAKPFYILHSVPL